MVKESVQSLTEYLKRAYNDIHIGKEKQYRKT